MYKKESVSSVNQFLKENNFNELGLNDEQIIENRKKYGINILKQKKTKQWYHYLIESLFSSFNLILLFKSLNLIIKSFKLLYLYKIPVL